MKKIAAALFLFISMAVIVLPASADPVVPYTLTLTGVGGANTDNIYIYPYYFAISGGPAGNTLDGTNIAMMCFDFDREIYQGETWQANLVNITSNPLPSGPNDTPTADAQQLKALAIIYSDLVNPPAGGYTASEYQFAAWSILQPSTVTSGYSGYDANAETIATNAMNQAATDTTFPYADYSYFDPIAGTQIPSNDGSPQRFMTYSPTGFTNDFGPPVPEPSSLMLLGTGVLGLASVARRRLKA